MALFLPLETSLRERGQRSQARMVGTRKISQSRKGQKNCRIRGTADKGAASWSA